MNYNKSKKILDEIQKVGRILLNCHANPDPDSIGSALAMYQVLTRMGKEVIIICPTGFFDGLSFLKNFDKIQRNIDFSSFDFSQYDLLIVLDSSDWNMVTNRGKLKNLDIRTIVIDHHITNTHYGEINLIDIEASATTEILYLIFQDWKIKIDEEISNHLLAGIVGDTGAFRFPNTSKKTLKITLDLIRKGADKDKIVYGVYLSEPFSLIKFYGEALRHARLDKENRFIWISIPYEVYKKINPPNSAKESTANTFVQVVDDTDFGFVIVEKEPNNVSVSFRSRTGVDVSKITQILGGGGHVYASGAVIEGMPFKKAVRKILEIAKAFAKENAK